MSKSKKSTPATNADDGQTTMVTDAPASPEAKPARPPRDLAAEEAKHIADRDLAIQTVEQSLARLNARIPRVLAAVKGGKRTAAGDAIETNREEVIAFKKAFNRLALFLPRDPNAKAAPALATKDDSDI